MARASQQGIPVVTIFYGSTIDLSGPKAAPPELLRAKRLRSAAEFDAMTKKIDQPRPPTDAAEAWAKGLSLAELEAERAKRAAAIERYKRGIFT